MAIESEPLLQVTSADSRPVTCRSRSLIIDIVNLACLALSVDSNSQYVQKSTAHHNSSLNKFISRAC